MIGTAFAQSGASAPGGGDTLMGLLPIIIMFVVMWAIMIRPQMKKAKEHKAMLEGLQKGCLLYTSPSPRDGLLSRMPSSA